MRFSFAWKYGEEEEEYEEEMEDLDSRNSVVPRGHRKRGGL